MSSVDVDARDAVAPSSAVPGRPAVTELVEACQAEADRFYASAMRGSEATLELFQRAVSERDEAAWEAVFAGYGGLVRTWIRSIPAPPAVRDDADVLVVQAFERFWLAIGPKRMASFTTGAAVLQYLKMCAYSAVMDEMRFRHDGSLISLDRDGLESEPPSGETSDLGSATARELWQT